MVKSPIKIIDSGTAPTTENLAEGQIAFGTVNGSTKLYGSDGATVSELGGGGTQVNNLSPLVVETAPSVTEGKVGLAIGDRATADGGIAIGDGADSGDISAMAIGRNASALRFGALAIGRGAEAKNNESIAIGEGSLSTAYSVAVGRDTTAENFNSTALGYNSYSNGNAVATGSLSYATNHSVAIGYGSSAGGGSGAVTIGSGSGAASTTEIDYDDDAWYSIGKDSVAIGYGALITSGDRNVVSFGNGGINECWVLQSKNSVNHITSVSGPDTRRLINVTDPTNAQDAATKNYVDTQLATLQAAVTQLQETVTQLQATVNNLTQGTEEA